MEIRNNITIEVKDFNGKPQKKHGIFIEDCDFGRNTTRNALEYSLLVLEAIDKTNNLNMFLNAIGKEQVNTGIFYTLLASILEHDKPFSDENKEQYFKVVKQLNELSDLFYFIEDDMFFVPNYELDMFVLGSMDEKHKDIYTELNYSFTEEGMTYPELVKKFKQATATE